MTDMARPSFRPLDHGNRRVDAEAIVQSTAAAAKAAGEQLPRIR